MDESSKFKAQRNLKSKPEQQNPNPSARFSSVGRSDSHFEV
jgi:hypothetical protein